MTPTILGIIISVVFLVIKNKGRNIKFKILSYSICIIFCLRILFTTNLGWWNVIVLPFSTCIGLFISLVIKPFTVKEAVKTRNVYCLDVYSKLKDDDIIGKTETYGLKQTYERDLKKILFAFTSSNRDTEKILFNLYTRIYYPVSTIIKKELENHVKNSINKVVIGNRYLEKSLEKSQTIYKEIFNTFLSILQIHEIATDNINRLKKENEYIE